MANALLVMPVMLMLLMISVMPMLSILATA
jgi:hypothetical protein